MRRNLLRDSGWPERARPGSLLKRHVVAGTLEALDRGTITLRGFLAATSQAIVVGAGWRMPEEHVPGVAAEVVLGDDADGDTIAPSPAPVEPPSPRAREDRSPRCGICRDEPPTRVLIPCGHTLCGHCMGGITDSAFPSRCPFCREQFTNDIAIYL